MKEEIIKEIIKEIKNGNECNLDLRDAELNYAN